MPLHLKQLSLYFRWLERLSVSGKLPDQMVPGESAWLQPSPQTSAVPSSPAHSQALNTRVPRRRRLVANLTSGSRTSSHGHLAAAMRPAAHAHRRPVFLAALGPPRWAQPCLDSG